MSTRSEIRFKRNGKQIGCVYHHSDGYPEHIIGDLVVLGSYEKKMKPEKLMKTLAKTHGTQNAECSHPTEFQGDIEYSYEVELNPKYPNNLNKVKVFKHDFDKPKPKKIFEGDIWEAHNKFVCAKTR